jgi:hypothetical protein
MAADRFILLLWVTLVFGIVLGANHAMTGLMVNYQRARATCTQHVTESLCEIQNHPVSGSQQCKWMSQFEVCIFGDTCIKREPTHKDGCGEGCFADYDDGDAQSCYPMEGWPAAVVGMFAAAVSFGICVGSSAVKRYMPHDAPYAVTLLGCFLHVTSAIWTSLLWEQPSVVNNSNAILRTKLIASRFVSGIGLGAIYFVLSRQLTLETKSKDSWGLIKILYIFEGLGFTAISCVSLLLSVSSAAVTTETCSAGTIIAVFFGVALGSVVLVLQPLGLFVAPDVATRYGGSLKEKSDDDCTSRVATAAEADGGVVLVPASKEASELTRVCIMLERSLALGVLILGGFISSVSIKCFWAEAAISLFLSVFFLSSSVVFMVSNFDSEMGDLAVGVARGAQVLSCLVACVTLRRTADDPNAQSDPFTWFAILATLMVASKVTHYGTRASLHESQHFGVFQQIHLQSFLDGAVSLVLPVLMGHGLSSAMFSLMKLEWLFLGCGVFSVAAALVAAQENQSVSNVE